MHNPCLPHQPPTISAVTRLHKVFKKDGGVEQRSSLKTDPAWPGHKKLSELSLQLTLINVLFTVSVQ